MTVLVMGLAESVARAAVMAELEDLGAAGQEMHVALTDPRTPHLQGGVTWCRYEASPEAWDALAVWCSQTGLVAPGAPPEARKRAARHMKAARRIVDELARLAKHPAYQGVAVIGTDPTVLPARRCGGGRWWPTARMALGHSDGSTASVEYDELRPEIVKRGSRVFTRWTASVGSDHGVHGPREAHPPA